MPESASVAVLYAGAVAGSLAGSFAVVHNMLADCMVIRWAIRGIVYVGIRKAESNARANRRVHCRVLGTRHLSRGQSQCGMLHAMHLAIGIATCV